jgi:preprotein translocase subunit SecG
VEQETKLWEQKRLLIFLEKATWTLAVALIVLSLASNFAIPRSSSEVSTEIKAQDQIDDAVIPNLPAAPVAE